MAYDSLEDMIARTAEAVQPAERLSVVEFADRHRWLNVPNAYVGPFLWDKTPYMREPAEVLTSREYTSMVFVGPARTGKSDVLFNWCGQTILSDPTSMMIIHMTREAARDWSQGDFRKFLRDNPIVGDLLAGGKKSRNTHDVTFASGMRILIKWPAISELSGKTIQRLWLADYDRMPSDVEKEGSPFELAKKRATTFGRNGMTVAESSPGFEITDPKWTAKTPHEAPPVMGGVLPLYNEGDRRRYQWKCPQCAEWFEPTFALMDIPKSNDKMEAAEAATLVCPHDGFPITGDMKYELNINGMWLPEGMHIDSFGQLQGQKIRTDRASFWLKGPAAGLSENPGFRDIVFKYLKAEETYKKTRAEESLKNVVNLDLGEPYLPKALSSSREPDLLKERAEDWGTSAEEPTVPTGAHFLVASVDVQKTAFVCQVHGYGPEGEVWFVDMFKIRKSKRLDEDGDPILVDPAAYPEDWDLLVEEVIERSYPLSDSSGRRMQIKATACDSGGREGVTANAYEFWRRLRYDEEGRNHHFRFHLVKGTGTDSAPLFRTTYPDSGQTGAKAIAKGDVPVHFLNSNQWKDTIHSKMGRPNPGPNFVHFPRWAPDWLYSQLTTEVRIEGKGWQNPAARRNEAWDLFYYAEAIQKHPTLSVDRIDWARPPAWAEEWDKNSLVMKAGDDPTFKPAKKGKSLSDLGKSLT